MVGTRTGHLSATRIESVPFPMNIVVGMSGGVDSSVAALLLKRQGHEVTGLSLELWDQRCRTEEAVCCSVESKLAASAVCGQIGIRHESADARAAFLEHVIDPFCASYTSGETPNPCVLCNDHIKFRFLFERAEALGADAVATGHYARIEESGGEWRLLRGGDSRKDQSYFLYVLRRQDLSRILFPIGSLTKAEVRHIAADAGLPTAGRPESQEICFIGEGRYADFVRGISPELVQPGPFVDASGRVLGTHRGIAFYTVGQRRRLGVAAGHRLYVIRIERSTRSVVLGEREEGLMTDFSVRDVNWLSSVPDGPVRAGVQVRSTMKAAQATVTPLSPDRARVQFDDPQWAPAPGQAAVFYDGERVLGGGTIEGTEAGKPQ